MSLFRQFVGEHGHARVPFLLDTGEYPGLGRWVNRQRKWFGTRQSGSETGGSHMTNDRIARLTAAGFLFIDPVKSHAWERKFGMLTEYIREHNTALVPDWLDSADYPGMGMWVQHQRFCYAQQHREKQQQQQQQDKKSEMSQNEKNKKQYPPAPWLTLQRIARLESVGFVWRVHEHQWDEMFKQLCKYIQKHCHANVPMSAETAAEFPSLGRWVKNQRRARRNMEALATGSQKVRSSERVSPEQIARLDEVGFEWTGVYGRMWDSQFKHLEAWVKKYAAARVPMDCTPYPGFQTLGRWCSTQRKAYRNGLLLADQVSRLAAMGFPWEVARGGRSRGPPAE
jgi:hypothetical protein